MVKVSARLSFGAAALAAFILGPSAAEGHEREGRIIRMTEVGDDVF